MRFFIVFLALTLPCVAALPPRDFVQRYCLECHDAETKKGGLELESLLDHDLADHASTWERVTRQLNARQMPPMKSERPTEKEFVGTVTSLTTALDAHAAAHPMPGRTETLRRLTRTEYQYAVRDLLGVNVDARALLPADEASHGFDNVTVGDLSPALLDRYLSAAEKIASIALGHIGDDAEVWTHRVQPDITQDVHVQGLPLGTRGGVVFEHSFPRGGEYEISVRLQRDRNEQVEGMNRQHEMEILLDDALGASFKVKPARDKNYALIDSHLKAKLKVSAGPHRLGVTFIQEGAPLLERLRQPYKTSFNLHRHPRLGPAVYQVTITGPFHPQGPQSTPSRARTLTSEKPEGVIAPLLRRAYRRAVSDADVARLMDVFRAAGGDFENGIAAVLSAVLVSREFLFRIEHAPAQPSVYAVNDNDLASRLSFFLWSSLPDEELISCAERGELHKPAVLTAQVRRMLADDKAQALITNFADQWLYLRNLASITPDARLFPDFDHNLREAMREETSLLVKHVFLGNRPVLELLRPQRTWLNERLAAHYDVPHIKGTHFREVTLPADSPRGGLLRHASLLTVTSYATRTSPVIRGHWILKNLVGVTPPPPPPNVPSLDENVISASLPIRERLAQHRANPTCASCHAVLDPVGFALEHYDAIGRWQPTRDGSAVDAKGGFPDGSSFEGVPGLEEALLRRPELFAGTLVEKLLVYALGRGIESTDAPTVRGILRSAAAQDYRFGDLIEGIVQSPAFLMRDTR